MFRAALLALPLVLAASSLPIAAGEVRTHPVAVLELFTSQGCSSCPEADALLTELSARPDIIPLAYHVDYWDYTGWSDTFGAAANTERQEAYAAAWSSNRIYTPQLVVNGSMDVVGSRRDEIEGAIASAQLSLPVMLGWEDGMLTVDIAGRAGLDTAMVWLVTYLDAAQVMVERGENQGQTLTYTHIVTGRQLLGVWEPGAGAQLRLPMDQVLNGESNGAVVLVQAEHNGLPGPILGAAAFQR